MLQIGCLDRRLDRLASQVKTLLHDDDILAYLDESDREQLRAAAPRFRTRIAELAGLGIPDTLVHGDLHANNIGVRHGRPIYFDWTDGCVAHPFLDLVTFTGESDFLDATPGGRDRLNAAYLDEWRDLVPAPALARAAQLIEPVGALHQAVSYLHMLPGLDEPDRSSMGRGGAFWLRTAIKHVGANASS
ncbi:MAG: phosphotransferase [Thermomicrobiales bacterium]